MNFRYVLKLLGLMIAFIAAAMLFPMLWSLAVGENEMVRIFLLSMTAGAALGGTMYAIGRKSDQEFYRREGLAVVSLAWIIGAAIGAIPFWLCPEFREQGNLAAAYFEAMSGLTTTGATMLSDIEALPEGLLFWRSFTQWLGGMGIVVLFVAFLPALGVEAKHLYKVEVTGIKKEGATPRIREAASLLWKIYLGMTVMVAILFMIGGMSLFDALTHTFTTLATGGFSSKNASTAHFSSLYLEMVKILCIIMAGTNFALYISILRGRPRDLVRDTEFRTYLAIIAAMTFLVMLSLVLYDQFPVGTALRDSSFQVVSIMTTTGYTTADFNAWNQFARLSLLALMFVGGCAGSTSGSMKVVRLVVIFKMMVREIQKFFFPKMVKQVKLGGKTMPEDTLRQTAGFVLLFIGIWAAGSLFMATMCPDLETAAGASIAALGNIGPGLGMVGAAENYGWLPAQGKIFLAILMVIGRLELFTVLALLVPAFWKE